VSPPNEQARYDPSARYDTPPPISTHADSCDRPTSMY
jgi:hypothetical protein